MCYGTFEVAAHPGAGLLRSGVFGTQSGRGAREPLESRPGLLDVRRDSHQSAQQITRVGDTRGEEGHVTE